MVACLLVALSIGSSWTVVATIGVGLTGVADQMELSPAATAGAVISGAYRLPQVPEGDIVVIAERAARGGSAWGEPLARAEGMLQRRPVAGIALIALAMVLGATLVGPSR